MQPTVLLSVVVQLLDFRLVSSNLKIARISTVRAQNTLFRSLPSMKIVDMHQRQGKQVSQLPGVVRHVFGSRNNDHQQTSQHHPCHTELVPLVRTHAAAIVPNETIIVE